MTMQYSKKTLYCKKSGLTEEEARISLLKHATIVGSEIGPLYEENGRWTASLFIPKIASPPFPPDNDNEESDSLPKPKDDSGESETSDEPDGDEGGSDSPPKPKGEGEGKPKSEGGGKDSEVLELLHLILDAIVGPSVPPGPGAGAPSPHPAPPGAGGPPGGPGGPPPGAGGPPPGPPGAGGPPGGPHVQEVIHKRVLKPGEAPPGTLPVGAPALSHTIPVSQLNSLQGLTDGRNISLSQATADLDKKFSPYGFKVAQIQRLNDGSEKIAALLSRR